MISFEQDEKIIAIHRRHPVTLFFAITPLLAFFAIVIAGAITISLKMPADLADLSPFMLFLALLFAHLLWAALFMVLADYLLSSLIITNQRIIAVTQKGLFTKTVSECALSKVQDTSVDFTGFLPTLLKYGNLSVRIATEQDDFIFAQIAGPVAALNEIAGAAKEFNKIEEQSEATP